MADDACLLLSGMAGYMAGDPRVHDPRILTTDFWSSSLLTVSAEHMVQRASARGQCHDMDRRVIQLPGSPQRPSVGVANETISAVASQNERTSTQYQNS